jgi:energy-coupling factor transporter transmembrane protein EcfT
MRYFDFDSLIHKADNLKMLLMVAGVYIVIFSVSWVYNRFGK